MSMRGWGLGRWDGVGNEPMGVDCGGGVHEWNWASEHHVCKGMRSSPQIECRLAPNQANASPHSLVAAVTWAGDDGVSAPS
jgi:hypothetical protein